MQTSSGIWKHDSGLAKESLIIHGGDLIKKKDNEAGKPDSK